MIHITRDKRLWLKVDNGITSLGMTEHGLSKLGQCFVFVPNVTPGTMVKGGVVLASVEGSSQIDPLRCPVIGKVSFVDPTLVDNPYNLTPERTLFKFSAATLQKEFFNHAV